MNDIVWVTPAEFAREYNKSSKTIHLWIKNKFILSLGVILKKDVTGHWYIGRSRTSMMANPPFSL